MRCPLPDHLPLGTSWQGGEDRAGSSRCLWGQGDITSCRLGVDRASVQTPRVSQCLGTWGMASSAHERMEGSSPRAWR